jgi:hypothetical protein
MKMKRANFLFGICACLLLQSGCATSQKSEQMKQACITGLNRQKAILISEEVLRDFNFSIAKEDPNTGYILTRPLAGGQFFEFWRKDNVGAFNTAESNIQSIRRTVELKMSEADRKLCINCYVRVQRLSLSGMPERDAGFKYDRITGQRIRSKALSLETKSEKMAWIELGNDELLASAILKKIEAAASKR